MIVVNCVKNHLSELSIMDVRFDFEEMSVDSKENDQRKFRRGNSELRKVNIIMSPEIIVSSWHVP